MSRCRGSLSYAMLGDPLEGCFRRPPLEKSALFSSVTSLEQEAPWFQGEDLGIQRLSCRLTPG